MRYFCLLITLLWCSSSLSQVPLSDITLSNRIENGTLSYNECMSLINESKLKETVPSLEVLKDKYTCADKYSGDTYFSIIMSLYAYYIGNGNYAAAYKIVNEAGNVLNQREKEPNNKFIRKLLCCRGQLSVMLKDYGDALSYLNLAQMYFESANDYGDEYIVVLINMALSYHANSDILSAKIYMDEAKEQYEKLHGSIYDIRNKNEFMILVDYGVICNAVGHNEEAERCFMTVINNSKETDTHSEVYGLACNNLSAIYMKQNRWSEGAKFLEGITAKSNDHNYMYAQNLAMCYLYLNDITKCVQNLSAMDGYALDNLNGIFSNFSDIERENYWSEISTELTMVNNLIAYRTQSKDAISLAYNNALFCKNLLVKSHNIVKNYASLFRNTETSKKYDEYRKLKSKLAYKSVNKNERDSLAREIIGRERQLLTSIGDLGNRLFDDTKSWKDVKESLDDDEIAIEFCYAPQMEQYPDLKPYYGAFVLRKDYDCPKLVSIGNVDSIDSIIDMDRKDALAINDLYDSLKSVKLQEVIWKNIKPYLNGVKKIYYSPTGYLSELNAEVLHDTHGRMMNEKYSMIRVSSTANIGTLKHLDNESYKTAILYGNIKYDMNIADMAEASSNYSSFTGSKIQDELSLRSENYRGTWGNIKETKHEVEIIDSILTGSGIKVKLYEEDSANEESIKSIDGHSSDIIHMSTHGFAYSNRQQLSDNKFIASTSIFSLKDSYMMWAGLVLAGGNNVWKGKFALSNVEDGILTADEISRLDLSNTKLVVLSACETARGRIDPIDGVYGLQRAFKMAGAETIVMSLWKVEDITTSMLMTHFYKYLTDGIEKHHALWQAMMDVKAKYHDPFYWAGFFMLD